MDNKTLALKDGPAIALQRKPVPSASMLIEPAADTEQIVKAWRSYLELKSKLLDDNDYQAIRGKKYIKKSGWRKIQTAFAISDELIREQRKEYSGGVFVYELTVKVSSQNGRFSYGVGSCASNERSFAHKEHDVRSTAHTRAKNRAISDLVGFGEVSAEEVNSDSSASVDYNAGNSGEIFDTQADDQAEPEYKEVSDEQNEAEEEDAGEEPPATLRQRNFLRKLLMDRTGGDNEQFRRLYAGTTGLTKPECSRTISALLNGGSV